MRGWAVRLTLATVTSGAPSSSARLGIDYAVNRRHPLADCELEVFVRCEDDGRFIEEMRADEPEVAAKVRVEERGTRPAAYRRQLGVRGRERALYERQALLVALAQGVGLRRLRADREISREHLPRRRPG
jgi:hypothetical protein